jgi:flagellar assembly protein FliH
MGLYQLENFDAQTIEEDPTIIPATSPEEHNLEAFEQGYKAGWDDAAAAQAGDARQISAGFARNLQELSFTLHEAKSHIIREIEPLLNELVNRVLPGLARSGLPDMIVNEVLEQARNSIGTGVRIIVAPDNIPALENLLEQHPDLSVTLVAEPSMAQGVASLKFENSEKQIDLDSALAGFSDALDRFYQQHEKVAADG